MNLDERAVARFLVAAIVVLGVAHFAVMAWDSPIARLFDLDEEAGFGTWFASAMALVAAVLAIAAAAQTGHGEGRLWWGLLSGVLFVLSVDEVAQVHEGISTRLGHELRGVEDVGAAGTPFLGVALLPLLVFGGWALWRVASPGARLMLVVGLVVFAVAAFGIEELEYMNYDRTLVFTKSMPWTTGDVIISGCQEILEKTGIALVVLGLLRHLSRRSPMRITVSGRGDRDLPGVAGR